MDQADTFTYNSLQAMYCSQMKNPTEYASNSDIHLLTRSSAYSKRLNQIMWTLLSAKPSRKSLTVALAAEHGPPEP